MNRIELYNNTIVEIPSGPIGISCSGGTDSSLLLYILMKHHRDPIHIFTLSNNVKGRANAVVVPKVIEKCIQLTGNINIVHHSYYADEQTENNLFDIQRTFLKDRKIDCLFLAITANPPSEVVFANVSTESRDPETTHPEIIYKGFLRQPFVNKDKKTIAQIYRDLGLSDVLFPITRSCEQPNRLEYYEHCGNCWWCEERKWGFGNV